MTAHLRKSQSRIVSKVSGCCLRMRLLRRSVARGLKACSSSMAGPHEYSYQTGISLILADHKAANLAPGLCRIRKLERPPRPLTPNFRVAEVYRELFGPPLQEHYVMRPLDQFPAAEARRSGASCTSRLLLRTHVRSGTTSVRSAAVRRFACSAAALRMRIQLEA